MEKYRNPRATEGESIYIQNKFYVTNALICMLRVLEIYIYKRTFFLLLQLVTAITTKVPIIKRLKGSVFFEHNSLHIAISI